jgi:tRNA threonylcarbamoyladenosine biosynthesis protein TsaE
MGPFLSTSPAETVDFAASFASSLLRNDVVLMFGELGSGKTQFVKGICRYFRVQSPISSPTFVMLHRYEGRDSSDHEIFLYHFDLYKVKTESEILELGYEEFFQGNGICLIEWGEKLRDLLPERRTEIAFAHGSKENERKIEVGVFRDGIKAKGVDKRSPRNVQNEYPRN